MKVSIITRGVREASWFKVRILAVGKMKDGEPDCPTLKFFSDQNKIKPDEVNRLSALLQKTAVEGVPKNEEKFKKVANREGLFEFKSYQFRLYCFFDEGDLIICTHGAVKKTNKADRKELERAEKWKQEYFSAKQNNTLQHIHGK